VRSRSDLGKPSVACGITRRELAWYFHDEIYTLVLQIESGLCSDSLVVPAICGTERQYPGYPCDDNSDTLWVDQMRDYWHEVGESCFLGTFVARVNCVHLVLQGIVAEGYISSCAEPAANNFTDVSPILPFYV
jgi:hypothetical protein